MKHYTGWIKTTLGDKKVEFDLENEALEIKTDSAAGSREFVHISVFSDSESLMGSIGIQWTITGLDPTYTLGYCLDVDAPFSKSLPAGDEKIWRITISKTAEDIEFTIHCNDEEMASVKFSEVCNLDGWKSKWVDNGKLQKIQFTRFSVAADYYRAYKPGDVLDIRLISSFTFEALFLYSMMYRIILMCIITMCHKMQRVLPPQKTQGYQSLLIVQLFHF